MSSFFRKLSAKLLRESAGHEKTQKDIALSVYSDTYKEKYGTRPRGTNWEDASVEEIEAEIERLSSKTTKGVYENKFLYEADEETTPLEKPLIDGETSIDSQVDRFLSEYESEAKSLKAEGLNWNMITRRLLGEAGEDEETDTADLGLDDADADAEDTTEDASKETPKKSGVDDVDVKSFVGSVMRLVDNYDSLLEINNTIVRRALKHLSDNYDSEVASVFEEELRESYGTEIGKSKEETEEDEFPAPAADRAGGMGGGGGG